MLAGKIALVTGGASGIGRASSLTFSGYGASVLVADRDLVGAEETCHLIATRGGTAIATQTDITDEDQVQLMVASVIGHFGRLDCAFNNAGIGLPPAKVSELEANVWKLALDVDLIGVWLCMKYELQHMERSGRGTIVNTASLAGIDATPGRSPYAAAKAGVISLTKTAAVEYATHGIRVNAVCPGVVLTAPVRKWAESGVDFVKDLGVPMARGGEPEEIAEVAAWLASDRSSYLTGQSICADGGLSIR